MSSFKNLFVLFLTLVSAFEVGAQGNSRITGSVIDSLTQSPVEFANVALLPEGSSTPIDGTICDEKGAFSLSKIAPGKYSVAISFIGFETISLNVSVTGKSEVINLGRIVISPTPKVLEAVTVEGEKALIEERVDRMVYNAENDQTTRGGDASDVLKRVPMLSVDLDGNVSLRGNQNILVLINNKPSSIVASSVSDALKQIPADQIKSVEVITSPSAKYDAEGSAGIINIITKKNTLRGLTLNVDSGIGIRGSNLGLNGNLRTNKMGFSLGGWGRAFYNNNGSFVNEQLTRSYGADGTLTEITNIQQASTRNSGMFGHYNLGWDFDIDERNTLAASVRFGLRNHHNFQDGLTTQRFVNDELMATTLSENENSRDFNNIDASFSYTHYYKKPQRELSFQSMFSRNNGNSLFENLILDATDLSIGERFLNDNDSYNQEMTLQADYQTPVGKTQMFELGAKSIVRGVFSDFVSYQATETEPYQPSTTDAFSNNLNYDQKIVAGYLAYTLALKNGYSFKAGGRYEHTVISAYTRTEDDIKIPSYGVLVPSVNFSKRLKNNNTVKVSYNRRIQRPSIRFLNPNIQRENALDVTVGNPELNPEYTNNFELSYSTLLKGLVINVSTFARLTNDAIQSVRVPDVIDGQNVLKTTYENIGQDNAYGTSLFLNVNAGKLSLNGGSDIYYTMLDNNNPDESLRVSNEGLVVSGRFFGSYNFSKGWGAQFFSFYRGRQVQLQGTQGGFYMYSLGVRKEFNEKRGTIGLAAENFLQESLKIKTNIESPLLRQTSINTRNTLSFRVTFSYRIGKMTMDQRPRRRRSINNDDLKEDGGDGMSMGDGGGGGTPQGGGGQVRQRPATVVPTKAAPSNQKPIDGVVHEAAGTWTYTIDSPQGGGGVITLQKNDDGYSGTIKRNRAADVTNLSDLKVDGNQITFSYLASFGPNNVTVQLNATIISKNEMTGSMSMGESRTFNFTASRSE